MPHPFPLASVFNGGMRRDIDRTELPGGSAYNLVDFIPDEIQAVTGGRGGWTYAGDALSGAVQIFSTSYAAFSAGAQLVSVDSSGKVWNVLAGTSPGSGISAPLSPPAFHRGYLILPGNMVGGIVSKYDGSVLTELAAGGTYPKAGKVTFYKDHTLLSNDGSTHQNRLWFSAAGDPTTWDLNFGWWDTTGPITAVGGLLNSILIFHDDSTERLRGTTPPPGSDMVLEPFLPTIGCIDSYSIAYWNNKIVWASSQGIHMSDGATVVNLTESAQMKTYWNFLMTNYFVAGIRIAGGIYRDHYIVSINNGSTLIDCLCVSLQNQTMWRFSNLHGGSFVNVNSGTQEKLYMAQWIGDRVTELSSLWLPSSSVKQDADGTNPTPIVETAMFRGFDRLHRRWIESMGKQKWRWAYVDYDLRDAASDNPTMTLSYCKTPTGAYTATDRTLAASTDITRVRRALSATQGGATHSQMLGLKLAVNGPYSSAKLLTLEGDFSPIDIGALQVAFEDQVRKVLSKPQDLPQEFLDYMVQYAVMNPATVGALRAPMMISTGTTGATNATRWVGSTTSGAPVSGYGVVGDFITTQDAAIWICTVAGSPGTWVQVGGSGTSTGLPVASLYSNPSGVSIAADNAQHYVSLQDGVSSAGFSTTDTATFENLSSTLFTGSAVYGIGIKAPGTYAIFNNSFGISGGTAAHKVTAYWAASNGSAPSLFQQGRTQAPTLDTWDGRQAGVGPHLFAHEWMTVSTGQTPAVLVVWGTVDAGTAVSVSFQMMVVQLTTNVLSKL